MISDWICLGLGEEEEGREGTRRDDSMALCVCREGSTTEILLPAFIYQFVTRRRTRLGWGRGDASSFSLPFPPRVQCRVPKPSRPEGVARFSDMDKPRVLKSKSNKPRASLNFGLVFQTHPSMPWVQRCDRSRWHRPKKGPRVILTQFFIMFHFIKSIAKSIEHLMVLFDPYYFHNLVMLHLIIR